MKIKSITKVPVSETHYDITVAKDHNFFANNVLTHNCNTSAVNAIIVGVNRGLNPVDDLDIIQMAGRAGRFGMAPYGNVFLICDSPSLWKQKIENPKSVTSTLLDTHALAFHLCAEIRNGIVFDANSMYQWYTRTLASIQEPLEKEKVDDVLNSLQNWKAIKVLENGTFEITALGKVAATLYYHPEDVYHWASCLKHMDNKNLWKSDLCLAYLVAAPTMQLPYIPKAEQEDVIAYMDSLKSKWGSGPKLKASSLSRDIHDLLGGSKPTPQCRPIQNDSERITGALTWISGILRVNKPEFFKILPIRLRYGCSEELSQLCMLPGIGIAKAKKLAALGITTWKDIVKQPSKVQQVIGEKGLKKTVDTARLLMRRDYEM